MNLGRKNKARGAAFVVGVVLAGILAAGAAASDGMPRGMSPQAYQALEARSQALNDAYGLGGNGSVGGALAVRSQALNQTYGIDAVTPGDVASALGALEARSDAMDARYHLGAYATVRPSPRFDWTDAGIGAAGMLGIVLVAAGLLFGASRVRAASVPRTT